MTYQKDVELKRRVNQYLAGAFGLPLDDYYGRLSMSDLLGLKAALSDINNAVTMRLTLCFVDWIARVLELDASAISLARNAVLLAKPSSNGYDVCCGGAIPFIAEVKCNVPINGGMRYGSAQRSGILKDVDGLFLGKTKSAPVPAQSLKFMVFLDLPEVRAANRHLLNDPGASRSLHFLAEGEVPTDPQVVYIVHMALEHFHTGTLDGGGDAQCCVPASEVTSRVPDGTLAVTEAPVQQVLERKMIVPKLERSALALSSTLGVQGRPSKTKFQRAIGLLLEIASGSGETYIDVRAADLHCSVGGYPGPSHAMPTCCDAMYDAMAEGDEILHAPPKKRGASVLIRYRLPRELGAALA